MKLLALALLTFSLASTSFAADEKTTVTGPRIMPGSSPSAFPGGGHAPGRPQLERPRFEGSEGGTGILPIPQKVGDLKKGDAVKNDLGEELGKILSFLAREFDAAGEIWVKVETPSGYKIEVKITAQAKITGKR